jgi:hypothetical protein
MVKSALRLTAALPVLALLACGADSPQSVVAPQPCACTTDLRSVQFFVVEGAIYPAPLDTVVVTMLRTGEELDLPQSGLHAGVVKVADDSIRPKLVPSGDPFHVSFATHGRVYGLDMLVGVDQPCQCHVLKISGPDFVVLPE